MGWHIWHIRSLDHIHYKYKWKICKLGIETDTQKITSYILYCYKLQWVLILKKVYFIQRSALFATAPNGLFEKSPKINISYLFAQVITDLIYNIINQWIANLASLNTKAKTNNTSVTVGKHFQTRSKLSQTFDVLLVLSYKNEHCHTLNGNINVWDL